MNRMKIALAAGAALAMAGAADAKPASVWQQCDGYPKPESGGTKLLKGLAALGTLGLSGLPATFDPNKRVSGEAGVAACTAALAAGDAPWIRKVTLNQWLAIHQLEAKNPEAALAALDAAKAAAGTNSTDRYFVRSTGVTLDVLRSLALLRLGRVEEGLAAAQRAAEARPYSARVQILALGAHALDAVVGAEDVALAERLARIDPSAAGIAGDMYLRGGRHAEAWALYKRRIDAERAVRPTGVAALDLRRSDDVLAAYAAARAGDKAAADEIMARAAEDAKLAAGQLAQMKLSVKAAGELGSVEEALLEPTRRWAPTIEAAALVAAGDAAGAQEKLISATQWPATPLLADLITDIRAKLPPEARKGLVAIDPAETRAKLAGSLAERIDRLAASELFELLPEPEDENRLNGFSKQFGFGLKETGFKSKKLESGLTRIEFVGSSSSPLAVEEMTLLRAAKLALAGGHKGFVVEKRSDFSRWKQMTMNGTPIGNRTHAGFMTQIEVRFVGDLADARAIDAAAVNSELAHIYIRPKVQ